MTTIKNIPDKAPSRLSVRMKRLRSHLPPKGYFLLLFVLALLSALACTDFTPGTRMLLTGEVAIKDVVADRSFFVEDSKATAARRELAKSSQPLVLDLSTVPAQELRSWMQSLFIEANKADEASDKEALRQRLSRELGEEVSTTTINILSSPSVQGPIMKTLLPMAEKQLALGVLSDLRLTVPHKGGVLIRNTETGEERLHPDGGSLQDLKSLELLLSQELKQLPFTYQTRRAVSQILFGVLKPTLLPNYEATTSRAAGAESAISPVLLKVQRGEIIVRQGEKVSPEEQMKLRALFKRKSDRFNGSLFLGISVCAALLSFGLLFAPSGKTVSPMNNRDFVFLAVLVGLLALTAKGFSFLGVQLAVNSTNFTPESLAYAVPVAGAAALSSLVYATRRYLVTGLLLAFFCTIMSDGGLGLFLFYFLACMWSTWLTIKASSRQDMVRSVIPLAAGLYALWLGATFLQGGPHTRYFEEAVAVAGSAFLSMLITFALAPVVEMVFSYTTRFRLMELLNLEQPLLRDLMLSAPGTYHHSLIVSNMVEAAAKSVDANSLLCKVAALYHDIGKTSKANYFIENQMSDENPHNKLSPSMSALILISHVKMGAELAQQHRLGQEVTDIIRQHHGNNVIQYFYQKALQQKDAPPPNIEDFRYPGTKPQTREAALVMLADVVEASSRTLDDPTPHRLGQHISATIKNVYSAGQLDETELTFRDLEKVADSFHRILRGIFHHRISYTDAATKEKLKSIQPKPMDPPTPLDKVGRQAAMAATPCTMTLQYLPAKGDGAQPGCCAPAAQCAKPARPDLEGNGPSDKLPANGGGWDSEDGKDLPQPPSLLPQ